MNLLFISAGSLSFIFFFCLLGLPAPAGQSLPVFVVRSSVSTNLDEFQGSFSEVNFQHFSSHATKKRHHVFTHFSTSNHNEFHRIPLLNLTSRILYFYSCTRTCVQIIELIDDNLLFIIPV